MHGTAQFQCPFEAMGRKTGSIIEFILSTDRAERLVTIREALAQFHRTPESPGIQFTLPHTILEVCSSLEELKKVMLPYQSEILAVDIDMRLSPFLSYQRGDRYRGGRLAFAKDIVARAFEKRMHEEVEMRPPKNVGQLAELLECVLEALLRETPPVVGLIVSDESIPGLWSQLMSIEPGDVTFLEDVDGTERSRNTFNIVKCPFYPKAFGRYSDTLQVFVNRAADVAALPEDVQRHIRRQANLVYQAHGVVIEDIDETHQNFGVWIPQYRT